MQSGPRQTSMNMPNRGGGLGRGLHRDDWRSLDAEEARSLRRRVLFWRSIAGLLLLGITLAAALFTLRRIGLRDRCRLALEHFARSAIAARLADAPLETRVLQWQTIDAANESYYPSHFRIFPGNWRTTTTEPERTPLAVCEESHGIILDTGRHVLYRENGQLVVDWVTESAAGEMAEQARRAEQGALTFR